MKKIKLYSQGIDEFCMYLRNCKEIISLNRILFDSRTFQSLCVYHIDEMIKTLQMKYLQMHHKGTVRIQIKFNKAELLVCSFLFKQVPVTHYMANIEYTLLEGL